jgi:hypothetical protein
VHASVELKPAVWGRSACGMSPTVLTPLLEEDGTADDAHANGGSLEAGGLAKVPVLQRLIRAPSLCRQRTTVARRVPLVLTYRHCAAHVPTLRRPLQDDRTFQQLLAADPDHIVEHIAERGTQLLGTFITEVPATIHIECGRSACHTASIPGETKEPPRPYSLPCHSCTTEAALVAAAEDAACLQGAAVRAGPNLQTVPSPHTLAPQLRGYTHPYS